MRVLLDTQALLWALDTPQRLGKAHGAIADAANEILFSAVSIWEIAIKFALKRADFTHPPEVILAGALKTGFVELPLYSNVTARVAYLRQHHRDPFDRLLVAQAIAEQILFYTSDKQLEVYSDLVRLI
jgi:PIN domain nuclease of toxin-antitoxin system